MKHSRMIGATLLAATALAAAGGGIASARHDDRRGRDTARLFTLRPDPAANPEGIAWDGRAFYVSDTGSGAIYRGTLDSDTVTPYIPGATGRSAVGLKTRRGKLYVAGGGTGRITVYDLATKQQIASFETGSGGFLNDLVVTRRGDVYVTDSFRPTLWHVTREQVRAGTGTPQALAVSPSIAYQSGFNLNGIVVKRSRRLVVVQSNTGKLFRIDLERGGDAIDDIDEVTGVSVPGGDGMLLDRGRLIVVQGNPAQLSFVKLRRDATRGELRATRTSPLLKGPSTIARAHRLYLVVNADFATSTRPFTVAGLPRDERGDDRGRHDNGADRRDDRGDDRRDDPAGHDQGDDRGGDRGDDDDDDRGGDRGDDDDHDRSGHGGGDDDRSGHGGRD